MKMASHPPRVLAVGGSDSGGSAGIQADLKTYEACGVFGCTALTMLTAQNTLGVKGMYPLPEDFIAAQMQTVLDDIGADATKTGFLGRVSVVQVVAQIITAYRLPHVVVDPVLLDGKGQQIVSDEALAAYKDRLFPLAAVITPNLDEAALLTGIPIQTKADIYEAARRLHGLGVGVVVVKGGHLRDGDAILNLVYDGQQFTPLSAPRLSVENPHGVGCTFASAIAAALARGVDPPQAIQSAHEYLQAALMGSLGWRLGRGRSPVFHGVGATNHDPNGR